MSGDGPELTVTNVAFAAIPVFLLIVTMLVGKLKWSAPRAGAVSWLAAVVLSGFVFGADQSIVVIGSSKGLSLSLFVLTIIWTSVLLYNVIEKMGGISVIGATMTRLVRDPLAQALIVGWAFSGLVQGVAGFGLPVAVVAPLLLMMGFSPVRAAVIALVGHSWAVTYGSLGSSFYTIQLVSGLDPDTLGPHMAAMFAVPTIVTGFAVAHLQGGFGAIRKGWFAILLVGGAISVSMWLTTVVGAYQVAAVVAGLVGCGVGWGLSRIPRLGLYGDQPVDLKPDNQSPNSLTFNLAFLPYYVLFALSIASQVPVVREFGSDLRFGLDYPETITAKGFVISSVEAYAPIRFLNHPGPLILASLGISYLVYRFRGVWHSGVGISAAKATYSQVVSNSVGVGTMVMMALLMTTVGMTTLLGEAIARATGPAFPLLSPYIGVLGTFMTGGNTNSNAMFGALQVGTAQALGIGLVTIAATHSIGASFGSAIAMSKVMSGTVLVGLSGKERDVLVKAIPYCILVVLTVGIQAWVIINVLDE